jgi:hypothetical protein
MWAVNNPHTYLYGDQPVITETVYQEALKGTPRPIPAGIIIVPDHQDDTGIVQPKLKSIEDTIQPNEPHKADSVVGTTFLTTNRGLITFDRAFCGALLATNFVLGNIKPNIWAVLRPIDTGSASQRCVYYFNKGISG